jgi:hypothetical protein
MKLLRAKSSNFRIGPIGLALLLATCVPAAFAQTRQVSFKSAPKSPIGVGSGPTSVAVADFNRDGYLDVAVANANDNTVSILLGNGDGTFGARITYTVNRNTNTFCPGSSCSGVPIAIAVGDFNGDGFLDLAITNIPINLGCDINAGFLGNLCSSVAILLGNGDGTFQGANQSVLGGHLPVSVAVGDFNGDGIQDLAVANLNSANVDILIGDGKGGFSEAKKAPVAVGTQPTSVAVGDFNGDNKADLAVTNGNDGTVSILLGNGDGTFASASGSPFSVGNRPASVAVADLNGDGKPDLAIVNQTDSTVAIFLGNGDGTFQAPQTFGVGGLPISVSIRDFNLDGKLDLAIVNRLSDSVSILLGNGTGSFTIGAHAAVGQNPLAGAFGDFNGDGQLDMAITNLSNNTASILLNNTDITPPVTTATANPGPDAYGWNNTSVAVTLASVDPPPNATGVKEIHYTIVGSQPVVVPGASAVVNFTTQGIFSLTYFAVDNANNIEAPHNLTVQIDLTPPTITSSQSPPANAAGWNNSNVTVSLTCNDDFSGVASCSAPINVSTEGAGQIISGTATDKAGNTASTSRTINLDKTPPVLTMPTLASSYLLNSKLTFTFGATDALSGVASMQATFNGAPITSGTTVTLTHLATNTFTLTATDVAGNTAMQKATFAVIYAFSGFLPPLAHKTVFQLKSTIPVKFQLTDAHGVVVSTAVAALTLQMISGVTPEGTPIDATASGNSNIGNLFRFSGGEYIYNLSTKPLSTGSWQLQANLDDGTVHTVTIRLK